MTIIIDVLLVLSTVYALPGRILIACLLFQLAGHEWCSGFPASLSEAVGSAFALRFGLVLATLVHEWAHLLAAIRIAALGQVFSTANARGHVELAVWLRCLNPCSPLPRAFQPHVKLPAKVPGSEGRQVVSFVPISGWFASVCFSLVLAVCARGTWGHGMSVGSWLCLAGATATDLLGWRTSEHHNSDTCHFFCGNFGLLIAQGIDELRSVSSLNLKTRFTVSTHTGSR